MIQARYESSTARSIEWHRQLINEILRSPRSVAVHLAVALVIAFSWSHFNGCTGGSINGNPSPVLDAILTWGFQFPIVTGMAYFGVRWMQRSYSRSFLEGWLKSLPDGFWGEVLVTIDGDKLVIDAPKHGLKLTGADFHRIVETKDALHLLGKNRVCLASLPRSLGEPFIKQAKAFFDSRGQDASPLDSPSFP